MSKSTSALIKQLYPMIDKELTPTNTKKFRELINRFINERNKELMDIAPCDRIYFREKDVKDLFEIFKFSENDVMEILSNTYYSKIAAFNPVAAKDPFTVTLMMIIRYFYLKNKKEETELAAIYLAFSGKFYPSIHYSSFPKVQPSEYRYIMEYVVNNELTMKFDLKREKSIFGAIRSICSTWLNTYGNKFKSADDEDIVYLIQQLHVRIKSFMKNIATLYYKAYANRDGLTYDYDNMSKDNYHLADNDSLKIERYVSSTMSYITTNGVDYKICMMCADSNIKTNEIQSIIESILSDSINMQLVRELVSIMIAEYMSNSKTKDISDFDFINFTLSPKPNTKNDNINRQKDIIDGFLSENSVAYNRRKSRQATRNSYNRAILMYFTIVIYNANK